MLYQAIILDCAMALLDLTAAFFSPAYVLSGVAVLLLATAVIVGFVARQKQIKPARPTAPSIKQQQTYVLDFPPSRQHTIASFPVAQKVARSAGPPSPEILRRQALPTTRAADLNKDNQYTPTGFSTQEIRALGRFPDYSILTGVPHPKPCGPEFDINKAIFRPFRPFRWGYHQTMCK